MIFTKLAKTLAYILVFAGLFLTIVGFLAIHDIKTPATALVGREIEIGLLSAFIGLIVGILTDIHLSVSGLAKAHGHDKSA